MINGEGGDFKRTYLQASMEYMYMHIHVHLSNSKLLIPNVYLILSHHRNKRNWKLIGLAELKDGNTWLKDGNTSTAGDE